MLWSTMLGGQGDDLPHSLIVNANNEVYVLGTTGSPDFPTSGSAYDATFGGGATFSPVGIGVSYPNGSDMVVARLSNDGSQLLGSTYLGGSLNDGHNSGVGLRYNYADEMRGEVLLDAEERVYVISCTQSADFPMTAGSPQPAFGGGSHDGVVARFDAALSTLQWSTYVGGSGPDAAFGGEIFANGDR
ncbi:MAG: hypothetical protein IPO12_16970 [Flavobacteriales bacterium]|nr:hypothetical protein [Flavobacteriales bacterium]